MTRVAEVTLTRPLSPIVGKPHHSPQHSSTCRHIHVNVCTLMTTYTFIICVQCTQMYMFVDGKIV